MTPLKLAASTLTGPLSIASGIGCSGSSAVFAFGWLGGLLRLGRGLASPARPSARLRRASAPAPVCAWRAWERRPSASRESRPPDSLATSCVVALDVGRLLDADRSRDGRRARLADVFGRRKSGSQHGQGRRREGKTPQAFAPHRAFLLEPRWANRGIPETSEARESTHFGQTASRRNSDFCTISHRKTMQRTGDFWRQRCNDRKSG